MRAAVTSQRHLGVCVCVQRNSVSMQLSSFVCVSLSSYDQCMLKMHSFAT